MNILAIDTSSEVLSLALLIQGKKIVETRSSGFTRHSEALAPAVEKFLKKQKIKLENIDGFAVGLGPGSFTGLRVGVSFIKTLAFALNKKAVGISSLEAIAGGVIRGDETVAVVLDAKKEKFYAAVYGQAQGLPLRNIHKPFIGTMPEIIKKAGEGARVVGHGEHFPSAAYIASRANELFQQGKFTDLLKLDPDYLHPRDCNATRPAKIKI